MRPRNKKVSPKRSKIEFSFLAPDAQSVSLAGDFNHWNPSSHPLQKASGGLWKISLNLDPGPCQSRFLVDGQGRMIPHVSPAFQMNLAH